MAGRKQRARVRARNGGNVITASGKGILTAPSTVNAGGTTVVTRYEIDTNLTTAWAQYSALYQKWKIHHIKFTFIPRVAITTGGQIAMCVQEDPDSQTITTFDAAMNQRVAVMGTAFQKLRLKYVPIGTGWLFTQDNALSTDRTEMPGDFNFLSGSYTSAVTPGDLIIEWKISFTGMTNSGAFLSRRNLLAQRDDAHLAEQNSGQNNLSDGGNCSREQSSRSEAPARPSTSQLGRERQAEVRIDALAAQINMLQRAISEMLVESRNPG